MEEVVLVVEGGAAGGAGCGFGCGGAGGEGGGIDGTIGVYWRDDGVARGV